MDQQNRSGRISSAWLVGIGAMCVAFAGTALAGPAQPNLSRKQASKLTKAEKKQVRNIARNVAGKKANNRITKRAPGLSVANAQTAGSAKTADSATSAKSADAAKSADTAASADDADALGGVAPSGYVKGSASVVSRTMVLNAGDFDVELLTMPGIGRLRASCDLTADNVKTEYTNQSAETQLVSSTSSVQGAANADDHTTSGFTSNVGLQSSVTTTAAAASDGHRHSWDAMPADGTGLAARIEVSGFSNAAGNNECGFHVTAVYG